MTTVILKHRPNFIFGYVWSGQNQWQMWGKGMAEAMLKWADLGHSSDPFLQPKRLGCKNLLCLTAMWSTDLASNLPLELQIKIFQHAAIESSLTECVAFMLISKTFYDDVCNIAYHTIFLYKTSMYNGFASLIASKPPKFFACRTRALYVPEPPYDQSRSALWSQMWARIVSKLPSIHYLEVFGDYSQSFEMRGIAFRTIERIEGLTFLTLDRALVSFLIDLISQNCAPVFLHLTHLKLLSSVEVEERSKLLLRSKSFPGVSHLMLMADPNIAERLPESFIHMKVVILAVYEKIQGSRIQTLEMQFPNLFVFKWDQDEPALYTRLGRLQVFKLEVNGGSADLWSRAESAIAMKA